MLVRRLQETKRRKMKKLKNLSELKDIAKQMKKTGVAADGSNATLEDYVGSGDIFIVQIWIIMTESTFGK